jgi:hypothetical protein
VGETTTVAILAIAAVGLFLIYEQQQQQNAVNQALLVKIATPVQPASNPLGSLASLAGPLIAAFA